MRRGRRWEGIMVGEGEVAREPQATEFHGQVLKGVPPALGIISLVIF